MQPSKTCVIIVSYRGAADSAACIRSLLASTVPVQVVVVDTTPNDPELGTAIAFAPNLNLIRASGNLGFGRGNNLGIEWAFENSSCDYVFLLNNDTVVNPESIETLEDAMAADTEVGIMTPRIAYLDDPDRLWYGGGEMDWRRVSAFTPGFNQCVHAELAMTERDVTFASGCALFIRASVLRRLGGFDPRFFMYEEDVELCLRAGEKGIRIRYIPRSLIRHRVQGSSRDDSRVRGDFWSVDNTQLPFYVFHVIRNRLLNASLHARGRTLLTAILFFPLFLIRRMIPFTLGGRIDAILAMFRGISDFLRTTRVKQLDE